MKNKPISDFLAKNSYRKCNQQTFLASKTSQFNRVKLLNSFLRQLFCLYLNIWNTSPFVLTNDSKMPKLKGVEGTKSHKKMGIAKRRRSSGTASVKGKSNLRNKRKKVWIWLNLLEKIDLFLFNCTKVSSKFYEIFSYICSVYSFSIDPVIPDACSISLARLYPELNFFFLQDFLKVLIWVLKLLGSIYNILRHTPEKSLRI